MRLLFVSPERLVTDRLLPRSCSELGVRTFAIDEAHCISHWGHDFRPEYRQLAALSERFPDASVHAFTATATERVRARHHRPARPARPRRAGRQLRPAEPHLPRAAAARRCSSRSLEVLDRHRGEAGIVYCIRRKDVDDAGRRALAQRGVKAAARTTPA